MKPYDKPSIRDLAIVMVYWNPAFSKRLFQNLQTVRESLDVSQIPNWIGEVAFEDRPFEVKGENVYQWRSSSFMFYKENVFMQIVKKLPPEITKVMLLDADILFERLSWYSDVSQLLDSADVCQPYSKGHYLDEKGDIQLTKNSIVSYSLGHPGFAWAFRRDWLDQYGVCEHCVVGGGDSTLAYRLGLLPSNIFSLSSPYLERYPSPRIEYLAGSIYHLYHGSPANRQYGSRHIEIQKIIPNQPYDTVVERREDGLLEWIADKKDAINAKMIRYFVGRGN